MRRVTVILVLGALLALLGAQAVLAETPIFVANTEPVTVSPGEDVYLYIGWIAGSPGLVKAVIGGSKVSITVVDQGGDVVEGFPITNSRPYWGPIQILGAEVGGPDEFGRFNYPHAKSPISFARCQIPLPNEVGVYQVSVSWDLHRFIDLGDVWGPDGFGADGRLDHYPPLEIRATFPLTVQ